MFFQGFSVVTPGGWKAHPLNGGNNVNGIDGDANGDGLGLEVHRSPGTPVRQIQEAYVRQVLETLHDLDNVLYEVVNEGYPESVPGNTISFVLSNGMSVSEASWHIRSA